MAAMIVSELAVDELNSGCGLPGRNVGFVSTGTLTIMSPESAR